MPARRHAIPAIAACLVALAGCTSRDNDRLRLGAGEVMPVFQAGPHQLPPAGPSIIGLDRSNWAQAVYLLPVHGTAHRPTYAPTHFDLETLARQRGDFPTVETALDLGEPDATEEAWQAARTHAWALLDAALILPRLVLRPPNATDWSPGLTYHRATPCVLTAPTCEPDGCCGSEPDTACAEPQRP